MRILEVMTFATLLSGFQNYAAAAVIYSNGAPDNLGSFSISTYRTADDFTLTSPETVGGIRFWWAPGVSQPVTDFSGTITYAIYEDSVGTIGSQVAAGTVNGLTSTPTGDYLAFCFGAPECPVQRVDMTLTSAVVLPVGTYWLELHEGSSRTTSDGTNINWATSVDTGKVLQSSDSCPGCALPDFGWNYELAFQLNTPQAVPEPATIGLAALGFAVMVWSRRQRG